MAAKIMLARAVLLLGLIVVLANGAVVSKPDKSSHRLSISEKFKHSSLNSLPDSLKVDSNTFDNLLGQLDEQMTVKAKSYFPHHVDADDSDELEYLQSFNEDSDTDNDDDADLSDFLGDSPVDISAEFGKREFSFTKVLSVLKNGTRVFSKIRQATDIKGQGQTKLSGSFNTTLVSNSDATASFGVNVSFSSKGQDTKSVVSGDTTVSGNSKSKLEKFRLLSESEVDTSSNVKISLLDDPLTVNSTIFSGSETFKLPFRSFFTLFSSKINTTTDYGVSSIGHVGGEVTSRVAFVSKNSSLTKSFIKAYVYVSSNVASAINNDDNGSNNFGDENDDNFDETDSENESGSAVNQFVLLKAKTHTWTKLVSKSESQIVVDVLTCTKARAYGKSIVKGQAITFSGTGQVTWEKSQLTISGEELQKLAPHEFGVHFITKQLESNSLISLDIVKQ